MNSYRDRLLERERMDAFRKEAAIPAADIASKGARGLASVGRGVRALGKGLWGSTRIFGKKPWQRVGGAAGTAYVASKVPAGVANVKKEKDEAMTPWQGKKVFL